MPAHILRRIDGLVGVEQGWRYLVVTALVTALSQVLLYNLHSNLGMPGALANFLAFSLFVGPQYFLYRFWVWAARERTDGLWREGVLFWLIGAAGLLASTAAVWVAERLFVQTIWLNVASLAAFGAVWVAKFFVLDRILFVEHANATVREFAG